MSLERPEIAENAKLEFAIFFEEINVNRSKPMLPKSQFNEFTFKLRKDIENWIFRFRANRGPFVVESNLCFLAVSKNSIFIGWNRIVGGCETGKETQNIQIQSGFVAFFDFHMRRLTPPAAVGGLQRRHSWTSRNNACCARKRYFRRGFSGVWSSGWRGGAMDASRGL